MMELDAEYIDNYQCHHVGDLDDCQARENERLRGQEELEVESYTGVGNAEEAGVGRYTQDEMEAMFYGTDYDWALALEEQDTQRIEGEEPESDHLSPESPGFATPHITSHQVSTSDFTSQLPSPQATTPSSILTSIEAIDLSDELPTPSASNRRPNQQPKQYPKTVEFYLSRIFDDEVPFSTEGFTKRFFEELLVKIEGLLKRLRYDSASRRRLEEIRYALWEVRWPGGEEEDEEERKDEEDNDEGDDGEVDDDFDDVDENDGSEEGDMEVDEDEVFEDNEGEEGDMEVDGDDDYDRDEREESGK